MPNCKAASAYNLSASLCFVLLAVLMLFSHDAFSGHYFQPKLLALTHLAALGWGTLLIFSICCKELPFIFKTEVFPSKPLWAALIFFLGGLTLLIYSFWKFLPGLPMQLGSLLLLSGILIFALQVFWAAKKNRENNLRQEYITTAFVWLAAGALLGVLMVFNFRFAFLPKDHLDFLRIHAHMGIAGWFLMLIIGLSIRRNLPESSFDNKLLSAAYYLINIALTLYLADSYFSGINLKTYALLLIGFTGLCCWMLFFFRNFKGNKPDFISVLSVLFLILAAAALPFIIHYYLKSAYSSLRTTILYGTFIFMGWITAFAISNTFEKYLNHSNTGYKAFYVLVFVLYCITFFSGLFFDYKPLLVLGIACLFLFSCLYLYKIILNLRGAVQHRIEEGEG